VRYRVLAAACSLALIAYIHRNGFATVGSFIRQDLGLTKPQYGALMSAFLVGYAAFEVPWALAGDRLGARHILAIMTLGWSLLTAGVVRVLHLPALPWLEYALLEFYFPLVLRLLFGVFQAGAFPAFSRAMIDWMPVRERATAQGLMWMYSRAGGAVAPFLFVPLIAAYGYWPVPGLLGALRRGLVRAGLEASRRPQSVWPAHAKAIGVTGRPALAAPPTIHRRHAGGAGAGQP
jgi:sugar phosphate permease